MHKGLRGYAQSMSHNKCNTQGCVHRLHTTVHTTLTGCRIHYKFAKEKVQIHDSTDPLVQGQLKGFTPRKPELVYIEILCNSFFNT